MSFLTPVDISNRALQHVGAVRIDPAQGFAENSKNASECAFCYDKLRLAELQRNVWEFAIKSAILRAMDINTLILAPTLWGSTATYFQGSIVADQTGQMWVSNIPNNLGNDPTQSLTWAEYFGPLTVMLYDSTLSYNAGELVYTTPGDGTYRVFLSLQSGNSDNPATATAWDPTVTYFKNQVVTYLSVPYMSRIDLNINQTPTSSAAEFSITTTYALNALVTGSDGVTYKSLANGNVGHDPTSDSGVHWASQGFLTPWDTTFVGGIGSLKWLQIGGAEFPFGVGLVVPNIIYPLGTGPAGDPNTLNVFRLPAGFLRRAPTDPKAGSRSILGASTSLQYEDWNFRGNYIQSRQTTPIVLWFVADTVDVTAMHSLFCEGLAARMALEICEPLTQSTAKLVQIRGDYQRTMTDARLVNGILVGAEEAPEDDLITTRV